MKINSTELQNNFGKYLRLCSKEEVIVTKNGKSIAKLVEISDEEKSESVNEGIVEYEYSKKKISYEEFLELTKNTEDRYELIDGELYLLASPKTVHQYALTELIGLFYNFFKGKKCRPFIAPYDIILKRNEKNINVVQPDLMVICDLKENLNDKDYYMGEPSLVLEIVSESSIRKDYVKKLDLYMDCGIKEYWLVNPLNKEVSIFQFNEKNIINHITYKGSEKAKSFIFDDFLVNLKDIFMI